MCGRFGLTTNINEIINRYRILENSKGKTIDIYKRKEIFPSERLVTITKSGLIELSWGMKTSVNSNLIINSRIENVIGKKYFYNDFKHRRCIVPANYFFEWDKINVSSAKYKIYDKNNKIFSMAGIYRYIEDRDKIYGFVSLLTRASVDNMARIHNRSPIILEKNFEEMYLKGEDKELIIKKLLEYNPELELKLKSDNQLSFI